jgi:KTSC domain
MEEGLLIRQPIRSTNLVSVGYEPDEEDSSTGTLEVEFRRGVVYRYEGVPESLYRELLFAESAGKFFHERIAGEFEGDLA